MPLKMKVKRGSFLAPAESQDWLRNRLDELKIPGLESLSKITGIDRGSLSRYFRQERTAKIDVIAPLCEGLKVSPETLLVALGVLAKKN
jgi:transcriptional regulator with XRE-family HTH domain